MPDLPKPVPPSNRDLPHSYAESLKLTDIGREVPSLSQAQIDIAEKSRSNPLTWKGQFSPQLVEAHLREYCTPGQVVLDPFVGSGTVLLEGLRRGVDVVGTEINPAAVILASLYTAAGIPRSDRNKVLQYLDTTLRSSAALSTGHGPLLPGNAAAPSDTLLRLLDGQPNTSLERRCIEALVVASDVYRLPSWNTVHARWRDIRSLVADLPEVPRAPQVHLSDARSVPMETGSVDLVLTSPPYINVFNYHQQYRSSVESLGWDVLPIARSEIGANRKFRSNRLLTVAQYCLDMTMCLIEVHRTLRPGGRAIFVVGRESNVRKTPFYNTSILVRLATAHAGFDLLLRQERSFVNRYGDRIYEDIVHLRPRCCPAVSLAEAVRGARHTAAEILIDARQRVASPDVSADLEDAIGKTQLIDASPILNLAGQGNILMPNTLIEPHLAQGTGK